LLHQESVPRWADGWALAARFGPAVAPWLRHALRQESNALKRLLLIGANTAAACGSIRDGWLVEVAGTRSRVEEQTLALLCLAVGPRRPGPCPPLEAIYLEERGGSAASVGAALAGARFVPDRPAGEVRSLGPGTESVAAAVRGELSADALQRVRDALDDPRSRLASELTLRAALLGRSGRALEAVTGMAEDVLRRSQITPSLRIAAAIHVARTGASFDEASVQDPWARAALLAQATARVRLRELNLLGPTPEVFADPRARVLLAAGYGLAAPWPVVAAEVDRWGREPSLAEAVTLCLAWRLLRQAEEPPDEARHVLRLLAKNRGTFWLTWAMGAGGDLATLGQDDPRAARAAALALRGQLDRAAVADEVEAVLWRLQAHPGRLLHSAWVELVRDALLAGSDHVSARLQLEERPPLPRGMENSTGKFFVVADSLYRFLTERVPAPPPECRLQ